MKEYDSESQDTKLAVLLADMENKESAKQAYRTLAQVAVRNKILQTLKARKPLNDVAITVLEEVTFVIRQSVFRVDLFLPQFSLVIETDGGIHNTIPKMAADFYKYEHLTAVGLHVFRITNEDAFSRSYGRNKAFSDAFFHFLKKPQSARAIKSIAKILQRHKDDFFESDPLAYKEIFGCHRDSDEAIKGGYQFSRGKYAKKFVVLNGSCSRERQVKGKWITRHSKVGVSYE